ncbi:MAG: pyrroline-5-carboxylate reductase [Caldilineales bacterium]|nr:pyrroline-5-carboxylate reductase [Caldilineales bacterium]MDW8316240.1 pyrroline-5-carboxylate reductase [Anaerolineae bacterium]
MLNDIHLSFIGTGVMAEAMIKGLLHKELISPDRIMGSDPHGQRGEEMRRRYGICVTRSNSEAADFGDVVVLSVKPQVLPHVMPELLGHLSRQSLVLSIVAGARISAIRHGTGHPAIVRSMPNTPAQVGKGMTVWTATPAVQPRQREQTRAILSALGAELYVEDESYLDMATALSGTGPAYVFLFMEALIDAGVHLGFPRKVAEQLVLQTMEGAVEIAKQSDLHPAQLRNMVTSPGGTSAEALYELEKGAMRTVLSKAVWAAYRKSKYLGDLTEKVED